MIFTSFLHIAFEILKFFMEPNVSQIILILQHLYDFVYANVTLECSLDDLTNFFDDIEDSVNYDYCSTNPRIYYALQQITILAEISEGVYQFYEQDFKIIPDYRTGYHLGESILGSYFMVVKVVKFFKGYQCEKENAELVANWNFA